MSEADSDTEKIEPQEGSEAEQLNSATESKATVTHSATDTVTKVKKVATPKQLEALRLARVKKMEKATARKAEYAKLMEKVGVEQSDSESSAEYVIKRVRKKGKKVTMNNAARCSTTLCGPPAAGIAFWHFSKDLGSSTMRFFLFE